MDPFSGSGTVLQESARFGFKATGFEINPSAFAMSNFFEFCNFGLDERGEFCSSFGAKLEPELSKLNGQKVYLNKENYREAYGNLLDFAKKIDNIIESKEERVFFMNMLFQSEKDKNLSVKESISKSFKYLQNGLLSAPFTINRIDAKLLDARTAGEEFTGEIDFILTSPPYINVFNYHQNYRAIIESFNFDVLKVAHSEFGSNRKNRGNRFKTVIQYCVDMELAIRSFWRALKSNAIMVLVVGRESNVRGVPFYNAQLVMEIIEGTGGFSEIKTLERQFTNKFGINIKEDILIATKSNDLSINLNGHSIAASHLEKNLNNSNLGVYKDIADAVKNCHEVKESPFFNPQNIILT